MKPVFIVLLVIIILAVLWLLFGFVVFMKACWRRDKSNVGKYTENHTSPWGAFRSEIAEARARMKQQHFEPVSIRSKDGLTLCGNMIKNPTGDKIMILFHGYRSNIYTDFASSVDYYMSHGFSLLYPDERAHGKSEGKFIGYGVLERYDAVCWCNWVIENYPGTPLFLAGLSMGSSVIQMASGLDEFPREVRGIIADSGFTSPWDIICKVTRTTLHLPPEAVVKTANIFCRLFAHYDFRECSTLDAVARSKTPTLFIHGVDDSFVPSYMAEKSFEKCSAPKRLLLCEGADHGLSYLVDPDRYKREFSDFINTYSK